jgi:uncharacterized protein YcfL
VKRLAMLALILLTGCAAKKKSKTEPVQHQLPINCIIGATTTSECKQISESAAVCNGVVVKFACIQVKKEKHQ